MQEDGNSPRVPRYDELNALSDYIRQSCPALSPKAPIKWSGLYPAAVFDDYRAEDGSYQGRLMLVVWPDQPQYHQVFTFNRSGELELVEQAAAMRAPETDSYPDGWICSCGNDPTADGFYPCDERGEQVEPTPQEWTRPWYVCDRCGRIIDSRTLGVEGYRAQNTLSDRERAEIDQFHPRVRAAVCSATLDISRLGRAQRRGFARCGMLAQARQIVRQDAPGYDTLE